MSDSIEEKAESRFRKADRLELREIRCRFENGILTLKGLVSNDEVKQAALEMIRDLKGIEIIDNQIVINDK
jgi:osmotically-inducible protein OsmY